MDLTREFHFDAAHRLNGYGDAHPNDRIHGHSFRARVTLRGAPDARGQIMDLSEFGAVLEAARQQLDHQMLNEIEGLDQPTLENICRWLWTNLAPPLPALARVEVHRDSLGQSCSYTGPEAEAENV